MKKLKIMLEDELAPPESDTVPNGLRKPFLISKLPRDAGAVSWLIALLLAMMPAPLFSQLTSDQILETMMNGEYDDAGLFVLEETWLPTDSVSFTYTCDYNANTISYESLPNQTINGEPVSITSSGLYDPTTSLYTWTTLSTVGSDSITNIGTINLADDPTSTTYWRAMKGGVFADGSISDTYTVTGKTDSGTETYYLGSNPIPVGTIKFSSMWNPTYNVWNCTGTNSVGGKVTWNLTASGTYADNGSGQVNGGFTWTVVAVPEPSSCTLFGLGTLGLLACRWRRRKAKA